VNTLIVIPARGNSKRVVGKNLQHLCDRPLIHWTIKAAKASKLATKIVVSTDHPGIASYAEHLGVDVIARPAALAEDHVLTDPVIIHATAEAKRIYGIAWDYVVTLQPTSPVRPPGLIDRCIIELTSNPIARSLVTVHNPGHFIWMQKLGHNLNTYHWEQANCTRRVRSQDMLASEIPWVENGSVYVSDAYCILAIERRIVPPVICYPMEAAHGCDIDTLEDFATAELFLKRLQLANKQESPGESDHGEDTEG
jgi:N-acylneuraminate cytidylyltransferase